MVSIEGTVARNVLSRQLKLASSTKDHHFHMGREMVRENLTTVIGLLPEMIILNTN